MYDVHRILGKSASFMSSVALMATFTFLAGCGGGGSSNLGDTNPPPPPPTPTVTVTCPASGCSVATEKTLQMSASATGGLGSTFTWSVSGTNGGNAILGTISSSGLYTAPLFPPANGSVTVKAVGSDGSTSGSVTVSVTQGPVPTLVAYTNDGCATCTAYIQRVFVFDLAQPGSTQYQLSPDDTPSEDLYAAISPDKKTVAYVKIGTSESLMTIPIEGGSPTTVKNWTDTHFEPLGLDWNSSGNGFVMAYLDTTAGVCGLATISMDGSTFAPIAVTDISCPANSSIIGPPTSPRFLSDGKIVYAAQGKVWILSADGQTKTTIGDGENVSLSPDSTKIVIDNAGQLSTADIDGTNVHPLTPGDFPAWCGGGDGGNVVFENTSDYHLYLINTNGGQSAQSLTDNNSYFPYCR
jgi:hypothetical protein